MTQMERLLEIMAALRGPDGCPWDRAQDFASIAPYTIEEACEVDEAIRQGDMNGLREELGDLLFQVAFHSRMAEEAGEFRFEDVARAISDKMVRRHPHVFGDRTYESEAEQHADWEAIKAEEKAAAGTQSTPSVLDDVPVALPALARAAKLGRRASREGFDWPDASGPLAKIREEIAELEEAMEKGQGSERLRHEIGDLLFAVTNLARHLEVDPEAALKDCNQRFGQRFRAVENGLREQGETPAEAGLESMDRLWEAAKKEGRHE